LPVKASCFDEASS